MDTVSPINGPLLWSGVGYIPFEVLAVAQVWRFRQKKYLRLRMMYTLLSTALAIRIAWFFLRGVGDSDFVEVILNRLSILTYFSGFYLYVLSWETMFTPWNKSKILTPGFIGVNAVLYVAVLCDSAIVHYFSSGSTRTMLENVDLTLIFLVYVILSVVLGVLGYRLQRKAVKVLQNYPSKFRRRLTAKLAAATVISVFCFISRAVMFLYHPLTGQLYFPTLDDVLYPYFFYHVPELVPLVTMMVMLAPRAVARRSRKSSSTGAVSSSHGASKARPPPTTAIGSLHLAETGPVTADDLPGTDTDDDDDETEESLFGDASDTEHESAASMSDTQSYVAAASGTNDPAGIARQATMTGEDIILFDSDNIGFEDIEAGLVASAKHVATSSATASTSLPSEHSSLLGNAH